MNSKKLGQLGEKIAVKYLQNKGYQILDRNYLSRFVSGPQRGEIDIIAKPRRNIFNILGAKQGKKNNTLHFIEVKTLSNRGQASVIFPEQRVDRQKQRKIIRIAQEWLMKEKIPLESKWQIDIISICLDPKSKKAKIRHFENAIGDFYPAP